MAIHVDPESQAVAASSKLLGRFILAKETNVRYLGLDAMAHLAAVSESLSPVKKHQDIIIASLKDRDISVRRRGLDLLYSMCDTSNSKVIVGELLRYLQVADYNLREEMVLKIAILTERFATEVGRIFSILIFDSLLIRSPITVRVVCRHNPLVNIYCRRPCRPRSLVPSGSARDEQRKSPSICFTRSLRASESLYCS